SEPWAAAVRRQSRPRSLALDPRAFGAEDLADRADRLGDDWERAGGRVPGARPDAETFVVDRDVWDALAPATGGTP
ncbi:hypothetical protein, partial [Cellulosimicrobium funkei]|uniref:hypothetical protein n=1 Tax=Cellulosimicrobium funkei TaxID=264251 RepID=UPI003F92D394